ncbi:MAG: methyltransferase domain-containing protein [Planctomycetes bacterium]|nr:methyltransferase domain-containing protein [Planctomycetota bacterium]
MSDIDARGVVLDLLINSSDYPTRQFGAAVKRSGLAANDVGLARQLLSGVLRHCHTLDAIYAPYCKGRVSDEAVRWTLRLGTFQLFYLSNVPEHAAIHATLQSSRPYLRSKIGFANAVLRSLQRKSTLEEPSSTEPSRKRLTVGRRSWVFDKPIFSDSTRYAVESWSERLSFPRPLVKKWFDECGEELAIKRMIALNEVPPVWIRVNLLRAKKEQVLAAFLAEGLQVEDHSNPRMLCMRKPGREISTLPGFAEGWWSVQDLTSLTCLELAAPKAGQRILDLCAAPGGKSFAAAELSGGKAEIIACDISESRLSKLQPEAERLGHTIQTHTLNADGSGLPEGPFDLIILDVPCTNTGVLNKRLEARTRFHKDQLHGATTTQNVIRKAVQKTYFSDSAGANGGKRAAVLWTTCSIEPEENEEMARRLAKQAGLELVEELRLEPDGVHAGGYAAMLNQSCLK